MVCLWDRERDILGDRNVKPPNLPIQTSPKPLKPSYLASKSVDKSVDKPVDNYQKLWITCIKPEESVSIYREIGYKWFIIGGYFICPENLSNLI